MSVWKSFTTFSKFSNVYVQNVSVVASEYLRLTSLNATARSRPAAARSQPDFEQHSQQSYTTVSKISDCHRLSP
jgi:hypothetical protein